MKLILIRHGQTDLNKQKKLMGRTDHSLNKEGIDQAKNIAKTLENINFDLIFSSPLLRAKETAEIIAKHSNMTIVFDDRIVERDFGELAGRSWDEAIEYSGVDNLIELDSNEEYNYKLYGGESIEDVKGRFTSFIDDIKTKYSGKTILVITHGGILRLNYHLFGEGLRKIENASIHEFEI